MKKYLIIVAILVSSFCGGSFAQMVGGSIVTNALATALSSWLGQAAISLPTWVSSYYGFNGAETTSQNATPFFSVSPNGRWAGIFASRTSDNASVGYTTGTNILYVYDDTGTARPIWGQYLQGMFNATAKSGAMLIGVENSISNQKTSITNVDPFNVNAGDATINNRLDCGVGAGGPSPKVNCTSAIQIINNAAKYGSPAIIIGDAAQDVSTDASAPVIALPDYNSIAGYHSAGVIGFKIFGGVGSPVGTVNCTQRCLYIREDGGAGSTLYINETGGGTSGWGAK